MEKFTPQPIVPEIPSSREGIVIKKLNQYLVDKDMSMGSLSEQEALSLLSGNEDFRLPKLPGITTDGVMNEMKKLGYLQPVVEREEKKIAPAEPVVMNNYRKLQGITEIEDEEVLWQLEQNKFYEEIISESFNDDEDLDNVHEKAISLEKDLPEETPEYYEGFEFLVERGLDEIDEDLKKLAKNQEGIKRDNEVLPKKELERVEESKKIATIVESGFGYLVTDLALFSDKVCMDNVCQFNDINRGVDKVLEVIEKGEENTFLAIGVDATYRGLYSKEYTKKFEGLLKNIEDGFGAKIKYFKNHQGQKMKEFTAPKIILYFDKADVKNLIELVRKNDDPKVVEKLKNSPQKISFMNQIMTQCKVLGKFAADCNNPMYAKYEEFASAIKRLGEQDPEIQTILDSLHEDEVSKHMKFLIEQYKKGKL